MSGPERSYYPPTGSAQAAPPGYVIGHPPKPKGLAMATGCTVASGAFFVVVGVLAAIAALVVNGVQQVEEWGGDFEPEAFFVIRLLVILAAVGIAFGAAAIATGSQLSTRRSSAWTSAVVVNVVVMVVALASLVVGIGLVLGVLSGLALWGLFRSEVRAHFGH